MIILPGFTAMAAARKAISPFAGLLNAPPVEKRNGQSMMRESNLSTGTSGSPPTTTTGLSNSAYGWLSWAHYLYPFSKFEVWKDYTNPLDTYWTSPVDVNTPREFYYGGNHARGGQSVEQMNLNFGLFTALTAGLAIINIGESQIMTDTVTALADKLHAAAQAIITGGTSKVILVVPFTRSENATSGWPLGSSAEDGYRQKLVDLSALFATRYHDHANIRYFDPNPILTGSNALAIPKPFYTRDHVHLTARGAYYIGKAFAAFLASLGFPNFADQIYPILPVYNASTAPLGNLFLNPTFTGTGGTAGTGASGSVPDYVNIGRTAGAATVAASTEIDGAGVRWLVVTFTPDSAAQSSFDVSFMGNSAGSAEINNPYSIGTPIKGWCRVKASAYADWRDIKLWARPSAQPFSLFGGSNASYPASRTAYANEGGATGLGSRLTHMSDEAFEAYLPTPSHFIEATGGQLRLRVQITIGVAGGSPTLKIALPHLSAIPNPKTLYGLS
jgi:hypothetical protein